MILSCKLNIWLPARSHNRGSGTETWFVDCIGPVFFHMFISFATVFFSPVFSSIHWNTAVLYKPYCIFLLQIYAWWNRSSATKSALLFGEGKWVLNPKQLFSPLLANQVSTVSDEVWFTASFLFKFNQSAVPNPEVLMGETCWDSSKTQIESDVWRFPLHSNKTLSKVKDKTIQQTCFKQFGITAQHTYHSGRGNHASWARQVSTGSNLTSMVFQHTYIVKGKNLHS